MPTPMNYRSTNAQGYTHRGHAGVFGADEGYGIELNPTSTGVAAGPNIMPCGDDANIPLTVQSKGTGALNLLSGGAMAIGSTATGAANAFGAGSTGQVTIGSSGSTTFFGGSTAPFSGFLRFQDTAVATPNFNSTNIMVMETTHVLAGISTAVVNGSPYFVIANAVNVSTDCSLVGAFIGSTAASNEVHCRWIKASTLTVAASTATVNFLIVRM
jgi:hypothetical protein